MQNREKFIRVKIRRGKFLYAVILAINSGNTVPTFTLIGIKVNWYDIIRCNFMRGKPTGKGKFPSNKLIFGVLQFFSENVS